MFNTNTEARETDFKKSGASERYCNVYSMHTDGAAIGAVLSREY